MKLIKYTSIFTLFAMLLVACDPTEAPDIDLPTLPEAPEFTMTISPDNPNHVIVENTSTDFFDHVFEFPNGVPNRSSRMIDTVFYGSMGNYDITMYASKEGGGGTSSSTKNIEIAEDATVSCDPTISLLTGDCLPGGKCWTLSTVANAITVGPTQGSGEWYTSPEDGLVPDQYDDKFCFYFDGAHFEYQNNGLTVDPYQGYEALPYDANTDDTWLLVGDQLTLPDGVFLGVLDSGPVYTVVNLTEDELVVQSPFAGGADGWFELYFVVAD